MKILIIEDDPKMRRGLEEMFAQEGYEVLSASNGREGLEKLDEDIDVVLTDLVMPGINGMEVLREVKRKKPLVPVVVITAFATIESAVEAMKSGASDYICKPFKLNEVQITIKRAIEEAKFMKDQEFQQELSAVSLGRSITKSFSNPLRRSIGEFLFQRQKARFTDIKEELGVDDPTKLSFHLRVLKAEEMIDQDEEKKYFLSHKGKKAMETLRALEKSS
jgi:DNA-binding response OmpR family regulator